VNESGDLKQRKITVDVPEKWQEAPLEPERPIVDPHHHLGYKPGRPKYFLTELLDDISRGHDIRATVIVESTVMYRAEGPVEMRPIGETEFANGIAAVSASGLFGPIRVCAGIVGCVDFRIGRPVRAVLEAHIAAGNGRFRGIRCAAAWDEFKGLANYRALPPGILCDPAFRQGFACLEPLDLSFDTWIYFTQLPDAIDLAAAFPGIKIIVNHMGGPVGVGPYAADRSEVLTLWKKRLRELSRYPNVYLKVGGLGMPVIGLGFERWEQRPGSEDLALVWRPYIETCVEIFGPARCMLESNFPPDKKSCDYGVLWNTFKRVTAAYSEDEKDALYRGTATEAYRLADV
jgi:predicted TIM-barrel fold metal-dependent hydrolase